MKTIILIFSFTSNIFSNDGRSTLPINTDSDILIPSNPKKYPLLFPNPSKDHNPDQGLFREKKNSPGIDQDPIL